MLKYVVEQVLNKVIFEASFSKYVNPASDSLYGSFPYLSRILPSIDSLHCKEVKQPHYKPGQALRGPGG